MIFSKISIGCLLLRIAVRKLHIWIIYTVMFISGLAGSIFFFVTLFQCNLSHISGANMNRRGTCVNGNVIVGLAFLYSAFSIIADFTFALLPAFIVWKLQLKTRTRLSLLPLLAVGCV